MSNIVPTQQYNSQLPEFMKNPALFASSQDAVAGIGGGSPPMVSIRQAKFRLIGADGVEQLVNQFHLDVIVLDGNPHVSKLYYAGAYDPNSTEAKPPTCWSDNGLAPSNEVASPQADLCANCQWGAWGSKVTDAGTAVKACTDSKKLAVVLAADTPTVVNGAAGVAKAYDQVYLLKVPAASMKSWKVYGKSILDRNVPLQGVVTRATFDSEANYPALLFQATGFVQNEQVFNHLMAKLGTADVKTAIGSGDQPRAAPPAALAAPAPAFMAPAPQAQPVPAAAQPAPARQRGRPRATPPDALAAPSGPIQAAPAPLQQAPLFAPPQMQTGSAPAQNGVIVQPQATDQSLDDLLNAAMSAS